MHDSGRIRYFRLLTKSLGEATFGRGRRSPFVIAKKRSLKMTVMKSTMLAAAAALSLGIVSAMAQSATTTTTTTYMAPSIQTDSPQSDSGYAQPASNATVQTGESGGNG